MKSDSIQINQADSTENKQHVIVGRGTLYQKRSQANHKIGVLRCNF